MPGKFQDEELFRRDDERSETRLRDGAPTTPAGLLIDRLSLLVGSDQAAVALVHQALRNARRDALPMGAELGEFVRAHMIDLVAARVGPRLTAALLAELDEFLRNDRMHSQPAPVTPRVEPVRALPCIVVVERDVLTRANLARTMIRGGFEVRAAAELDDLRRLEPPVDVVLIDIAKRDPAALHHALAAHVPPPAVMAWTSEKRLTATRILREAQIEHGEVIPRSASTAELLAVIRQLLTSRAG